MGRGEMSWGEERCQQVSTCQCWTVHTSRRRGVGLQPTQNSGDLSVCGVGGGALEARTTLSGLLKARMHDLPPDLGCLLSSTMSTHSAESSQRPGWAKGQQRGKP